MGFIQASNQRQGNDSLVNESGAFPTENAVQYAYPNTYMGKPRSIRIVVIGAGVSGIAAVKMFKDRFKDKPVELVIYERNAEVGGTWLENRYPGCACDVPAHAYSYSWEGNPNWSHAYVGSVELFDYFKSRAVAYGVYDYVHLEHEVESAEWNTETGQWDLRVRDLNNKKSFDTQAEVLINAAGFLNKWKWPEIQGIGEFKGHLAHSARWDDTYNFTGKTVAVIGSGSSAIQIVPELQGVVKHMVSFNRSATWISPEFAADFAPEGRETAFCAEQQEKWTNNPDLYRAYRKRIEGAMNTFFDVQYKDSVIQKAAFKTMSEAMAKRLSAKPELASTIIPKFAVGCRRLTPGYRYLESLVEKNVDVETQPILKIDQTGIETQSGKGYEVDAIVCATGFDTSYKPAFPVYGFGGKDLREIWKDEPRSYLSVAASGFPNYFIIGGPNFPLANGTLIPCLEKCLEYAFRAVDKIQCSGVKSLHPKSEAVDEFQEHKDALMNDLVWTSGCRSWYKNGKVDGKVFGPWCGSSIHFLELMDEPRWEDWEFEYTTKNRFQYLGNVDFRLPGLRLNWPTFSNSGALYAFGDIGWKYFLVFILAGPVGALLVWLYGPETKGKTLEEIGGILGDELAVPELHPTDESHITRKRAA
ncbi:hypothetical protein Z517_06080 [Fonsecaea pedrosoi CBS 271.37]|uniref:Unplaced genomic scaffold supercont1.4, whole genome shotgun sequence n=1 Tax=Fonsecaea pedrosoi CBS 271.37 TaxID=1442368 RepID=A0A0D2GF89_9EURO|nr:uncharacterized protein Z517_06080 [Fonsecaea pedrosoi CBS 271.37]KIW79468.1 hypothetical protein Z517_06080 [Fonsecaea pedrosoi CBS 271.37]